MSSYKNNAAITVSATSKDQQQQFKSATRFLAFLLFCFFTSLTKLQAQRVDTIYYTWGDAPKQDASFNSKATISGTVKDAQGNPLAQAEILFDDVSITKTDDQGKFQFEKSFSGYPKTWTLVIRHPSMADVIRTYHPAALSANYDVVMKSGEGCCCGVAYKPVNMEFNSKIISLNEEMKTKLESIASTLRQNPNSNLELTGYGKNGIENTVVKYRQEAIRNVLVDEEGISGERIHFKSEIEESKKNMVSLRIVR